jgi:cytochrome c biogenesis protein CcmG/thiol:disulfide interchange protein DsbE
MRRLLSILCLLLAATAVEAKLPKAGQPAPNIVATTLDGARFSLADQRGKVVILNFWATWCLPCREEMPALEAFYRAHRSDGLVVIAISLDEPAELASVRKLMAAYSYPAALVANTDAKAYGRLWRLPLTFVVGRDGILRRDGWKAAPRIDAAVLDAEVLPLLGAPAHAD